MGTLCDTLWCGCDDSNHNKFNVYGDGRPNGHEINLATFSLASSDGEYQRFKNRRNCQHQERREIYAEADMWMDGTGRDYRFVAIKGEQAAMDSNIPRTFPILLRSYLNSIPYSVKNIKVYIDGLIRKNDKKNILLYFPDFPNMKVHSIVKRKVGKMRVVSEILKCPKVLWAADIWANKIWRLGEEGILAHEKRVAVP